MFSVEGSAPNSLSVSPDTCLGSLSTAGTGLVLNNGAMTTPTYTIRPAELDDMPAILRLIGSSAAWLQQYKKTDQWARPWPNRDERDTRVAQGIMDHLTYMVEDGAGTL